MTGDSQLSALSQQSVKRRRERDSGSGSEAGGVDGHSKAACSEHEYMGGRAPCADHRV